MADDEPTEVVIDEVDLGVQQWVALTFKLLVAQAVVWSAIGAMLALSYYVVVVKV